MFGLDFYIRRRLANSLERNDGICPFCEAEHRPGWGQRRCWSCHRLIEPNPGLKNLQRGLWRRREVMLVLVGWLFVAALAASWFWR